MIIEKVTKYHTLWRNIALYLHIKTFENANFNRDHIQ